MSSLTNRSTSSSWSKAQLQRIDDADDLHISPLRDDGIRYGTPTWIWSIVLNDGLYVRAYNGQSSRWYQAAMRQKAGRIRAGGMTKDVDFVTAPGALNADIDESYRAKYSGSRYLTSMIGVRARSATVQLIPRDLEAI